MDESIEKIYFQASSTCVLGVVTCRNPPKSGNFVIVFIDKLIPFITRLMEIFLSLPNGHKT